MAVDVRMIRILWRDGPGPHPETACGLTAAPRPASLPRGRCGAVREQAGAELSESPAHEEHLDLLPPVLPDMTAEQESVGVIAAAIRATAEGCPAWDGCWEEAPDGSGKRQRGHDRRSCVRVDPCRDEQGSSEDSPPAPQAAQRACLGCHHFLDMPPTRSARADGRRTGRDAVRERRVLLLTERLVVGVAAPAPRSHSYADRSCSAFDEARFRPCGDGFAG